MLERVIRIIAEYADVSPEEINENTNIRGDPGPRSPRAGNGRRYRCRSGAVCDALNLLVIS